MALKARAGDMVVRNLHNLEELDAAEYRENEAAMAIFLPVIPESPIPAPPGPISANG